MMKLRKVMLAAMLLVGFSSLTGCGETLEQVQKAREYAEAAAQYKDEAVAAEEKVKKLLESAEPHVEGLLLAFDTDGDGKISKEEALAQKPKLTTMFISAITTGDWGELLAFILLMLGLHTTKLRSKIKEYGTAGVLGWVFKILDFVGKPKKEEPKE